MSIVEYIKGTQAELKHVNWPSKEQTIRFTGLVIGVCIVTGIILGVSDFIFPKLLTLLF